MTKQEFTELANKHLVALDGYKLDKNGNTKIEIFGIEKLYEAINYTRCCTELKDKEAISFEDWLKVNYVKKDNIYLSKQSKSGWYTIREVKKEYNIEFNL
jgi:hypothetical protein